MTVESTIHAWVVTGSALAAARVRWANQTDTPIATAGAWISLLLLAQGSGGQDWNTSAIEPLVVDDTVESVDATANTLTLTAHGLLTGDGPVRLTTTGTLPGGLAVDTDYWIIRISANAIHLSATFLGAIEAPSPIDLTSTGAGTHSLVDVAAADDSAGVGTVRAGSEILTTTHGTRAGTLSIQCFGGGAVGASSSAGILERLKAASKLPSVLDALSVGGVGIGSLGPVRDLSGILQPGVFEPRATLEVLFHAVALELSEAATVIETIAATGTVT